MNLISDDEFIKQSKQLKFPIEFDDNLIIEEIPKVQFGLPKLKQIIIPKIHSKTKTKKSLL